MTKRIGDLPPKLVGEKILTKVPITSVGAVRSTCKLWESLSREWILGKAAAKQQFMGFMTKDSKVCSLRFQHRKDEGLVDLSIKQVDSLNQVEISKVFQCDGLLLCVTKDNSRLVAWNPYLGQTRWMAPRTRFHSLDRYALGYDRKNRNHKILRFLDLFNGKDLLEFEIYDFSSNSWRVIEVTPDWEVEFYQRGASLKGNTYFFAHETLLNHLDPVPPNRRIVVRNGSITDYDDFLLCFDFTSERFGPRLPLPFHSYTANTVSLSCVRHEQLAVLYQHRDSRAVPYDGLEVWVTTMIEPNAVSWSKFLNVDMKPFTSLGAARFDHLYGSFFIDEEEKLAVVFDEDGFLPTETARYHTAFIIGEDGYFKSVTLGEAPNVYVPETPIPPGGYMPQFFSPPLVCSSSYLPSLVQLNQPRKRKERDW